MSDFERERRGPKKRPRSQNSLGDYDVGFSKPPLHSRFSKGQSGNPKGRPKGAELAGHPEVHELIAKELYRKVSVRDAGRVIEMPGIDVIVRAWIGKAQRGDVRAIRSLLAYVDDRLPAMTPITKILLEKVPVPIMWIEIAAFFKELAPYVPAEMKGALDEHLLKLEQLTSDGKDKSPT